MLSSGLRRVLVHSAAPSMCAALSDACAAVLQGWARSVLVLLRQRDGPKAPERWVCVPGVSGAKAPTADHHSRPTAPLSVTAAAAGPPLRGTHRRAPAVPTQGQPALAAGAGLAAAAAEAGGGAFIASPAESHERHDAQADAPLRLQPGDAVVGCALLDAQGRRLGVVLAIGAGAPCHGAAAPPQLLGTLCGLAALPLGHALAHLHRVANMRAALGPLPGLAEDPPAALGALSPANDDGSKAAAAANPTADAAVQTADDDAVPPPIVFLAEDAPRTEPEE